MHNFVGGVKVSPKKTRSREEGVSGRQRWTEMGGQLIPGRGTAHTKPPKGVRRQECASKKRQVKGQRRTGGCIRLGPNYGDPCMSHVKELVRLDPKVNGKPLKCLLWVAGEGGNVGNIIILGFRVTENRSWSLSWR